MQYPSLGKEPLIGVISPYKSQVKLIRKELDSVLPDIAPLIDVNTIDGFQGREKDVIIFSTVRTVVGKKRARIGFVADERRINVGLTRCRCSLIVVGHRHALAMDKNWGALIRATSERGCARWRPLKLRHVLQQRDMWREDTPNTEQLLHANGVYFLSRSVTFLNIARLERVRVNSARALGAFLPSRPRAAATWIFGVYRTLFEAKPKFKKFLQDVLARKALPVKVELKSSYLPQAEDDAPVVPSKRSATQERNAGKKRSKKV
jgi:hypothetical protein